MRPAIARRPAAEQAQVLVVDLDHTLVRTDTLFEQFVALVFRAPVSAIWVLMFLLGGRAAFKARLALLQPLDPASLPYREPLLAFLREEKSKGRRLHLVTAADQSIADAVALHCGLFDSAEGTQDGVNLKGARKAGRLRERFPEGFAYAGDSSADLAVWAHSESIILAGARPAVARRAHALAKPVEAWFAPPTRRLNTWRRALRIHQWAKNLLVFVPLVLSQQYRNPQAIGLAVAAFVALGLVASATYLINDLSDLPADRGHATKSLRPLATGDLPISSALIAVPILLALGFGLAVAASPALLGWIAAYAALTLTYTFYLKRQALLDVATLGALYGLRLIIGGSAIEAPHSVWLLTFSIFFFFSMSLAKRYAEIANLAAVGREFGPKGRGYKMTDGPVILALGVASSIASVIIVVLYLMEEAFPSNLYSHPNWLWVTPFLLMIWAARIWLIAGRGELDEDPVAFAIYDRFSWMLAIPLVIGFVLATLAWP